MAVEVLCLTSELASGCRAGGWVWGGGNVKYGCRATEALIDGSCRTSDSAARAHTHTERHSGTPYSSAHACCVASIRGGREKWDLSFFFVSGTVSGRTMGTSCHCRFLCGSLRSGVRGGRSCREVVRSALIQQMLLLLVSV